MWACLHREGDVRDGVVVAGHGQLRCKVAEGTVEEVASTGANVELSGQTGAVRCHQTTAGEHWWAHPPTSCPLPLSAREVMAPSTLQYLGT